MTTTEIPKTQNTTPQKEHNTKNTEKQHKQNTATRHTFKQNKNEKK